MVYAHDEENGAREESHTHAESRESVRAKRVMFDSHLKETDQSSQRSLTKCKMVLN